MPIQEPSIEIINELNDNFDIENPLFLKQVLLLNYYLDNTKEPISDIFRQEFEKLQKKCYNNLIKVEKIDQPSIEKQSSIKQYDQNNQCGLFKIAPSQMATLYYKPLPQAIKTLFFPAFRE